MSNNTVRLRYTGDGTPTFTGYGVGTVEHGSEFEVPETALLSFMRRPDIEHASECPSPPCRCGEEPEAPREPGTGSEEAGEREGGRSAKRAARTPETSP